MLELKRLVQKAHDASRARQAKRRQAKAWETLERAIDSYLRRTLSAMSRREKKIWQFVLVAAAALEATAENVLWVSDGNALFDGGHSKRPRHTLTTVAQAIERKRILPASTINILHAVADFRNSVAHDDLFFGFGIHIPRSLRKFAAKSGYELPRHGEYREHHFSEPEAVERFARDVDEAVDTMVKWLAQRAK
jgi:hypothetical protein